MATKRAGTRPNGPVARSSEHKPRSYLSDISNPQAMDPKLPDLAAKPSWGYGSSTTQKDIPRQMSDQSGLNVTAMAASIESGVKHAQDRDQAQEEFRNTNRNNRGKSRSTRRSVSASVSPMRRGRNREPTPDQVQLLGTLREVTASPKANGDDASQQDQSTPTPTPPIPHALSTASSPPPAPPEYPILPSNEPLYPSPLLQRGSPIYRENSWSSHQYEGDIDNESILSWNVERDIHEDDLKRTHPITFREQPQGKNITAPPRRFSGRAFINETIEEEDEPVSEPSIEKSPTPRPPPEVQTNNEVPPRPRSEPRSEPEPEPEPFTAPTRTIIPRSDMRETSFHESSPPSPPKSGKSTIEAGMQSVRETSSSFQESRAVRIVAIILLAATSMFTTYWFSDNLADISRGISSSFPFGKQSPYIPFNATGMDAINSLSRHVARIDTRVSSLSGELNTVKSDVENLPPPTTIIEPAPVRTTAPTPRGINFLTHGMGVTIDHLRTSPTVGQASSFWRRTSRRMHEFYDGFFASDSENKQSPPPLMALMPWEDVGDCWCSTPESGVSQLSIELGRQIVPEDVVIEHMPKEATIKPEVAPKEMELWAQFVVKSDDLARSSSSWIPSSLASSKKSPKQSVPSGQSSLHEYVMETLRNTWRGEPDTSFSDDELLGPSFYRIGRWTYDINSVDHIQEFSLDTIMYSIRVDHVVFRVKSNWGGNDTCLYRLRLYGQL